MFDNCGNNYNYNYEVFNLKSFVNLYDFSSFLHVWKYIII